MGREKWDGSAIGRGKNGTGTQWNGTGAQWDGRRMGQERNGMEAYRDSSRFKTYANRVHLTAPCGTLTQRRPWTFFRAYIFFFFFFFEKGSFTEAKCGACFMRREVRTLSFYPTHVIDQVCL